MIKFFVKSLLVSLMVLFIIPFEIIPNEVAPYYKEFIEIVQKECPKVKPPIQFSIYFKPLKNEEVGLCTLYTFRSKIEIDTFFWVNATDQTRRQLVFHELTHCILETHHTDDIQNYMNAYIIPLPKEVLIEQVRNNARSFCN